ncbi:MAG: hypothetical protein II984_01355 [Clostridia bacterium]|nr:hypothetical protein [Clostridia bacterium]
MRKAKAWVHKKLKQGVPKQELLNCVGAFSNKDKSKVMKEKNLNEKQYKRRYNFLYEAYCYLENL